MEHREAQEGIAKMVRAYAHLYCNAILKDKPTPYPNDAVKEILPLIFSPKEIEEWKKGGYPAIVCKDQSAPYPDLWDKPQYVDTDGLREKGFVRIVKEE